MWCSWLGRSVGDLECAGCDNLRDTDTDSSTTNQPFLPVMSSAGETQKRGRGRPPNRAQQSSTNGTRQLSLQVDDDAIDGGAGSEDGEIDAESPSTDAAAPYYDIESSVVLPPRSATSAPATKRRKSNAGSDDDERSEDNVMAEFRNGPRLDTLVNPIPKPDFGKENHMWFQTTQVSHMSTLLKCLSLLLTDANIIFAPGGWRITAMNSKKSALISWRCTDQTLEDGLYECNFNYRIRVPIDELAYRIKMCRRSEMMTLELRGDNPSELGLMFSRGPGRVTKMKLRLLTPDDIHIDTPPLTYHTQVDLPADELREVLGGVKSDSLIQDVTFTKSQRQFSILVSTVNGPIETVFKPDNSPDSVRFMIAGNDDRDTMIEEADSASVGTVYRSTLSLEEIISFSEVTRASKWVQINMPENDGPTPLPLKMEYSIAALGKISFLLAPKVDDDEDGEDEGANGDSTATQKSRHPADDDENEEE
jgi:hypothetical protein